MGVQRSFAEHLGQTHRSAPTPAMHPGVGAHQRLRPMEVWCKTMTHTRKLTEHSAQVYGFRSSNTSGMLARHRRVTSMKQS
jgi:hypothetical protein